MMHLQLCSLCHCRSFRNLDSNQLNGTIPPQLGNLTKLTTLYTQNRSASIDTVIISDLTLLIVSDLTFLAYYILSDSTLMLKILHLVLIDCVIVALSGISTRISSVARSLLSSASSQCCKCCTSRIAIF